MLSLLSTLPILTNIDQLSVGNQLVQIVAEIEKRTGSQAVRLQLTQKVYVSYSQGLGSVYEAVWIWELGIGQNWEHVRQALGWSIKMLWWVSWGARVMISHLQVEIHHFW